MYDNKVSKRQAEVILPYTTTMFTPLTSALNQESNETNRSTPTTTTTNSNQIVSNKEAHRPNILYSDVIATA